MPSQESKPSNSQRNFVFPQIRRLHKAIVTAVEEKGHGFDLQQTQRSLKDHIAEAEQITIYVDPLSEYITGDSLINSFTDLQHEIDDTVRKFKQMLKETNQHIDPTEPSSHNQPTSYDNQPSTSALPQFRDSLGDQLTHQNT